MKIALVITAAGESTRFGRPKLFEDVAGRPLIYHTLKKFEHLALSQIVVTCRPGDEERLKNSITIRCKIVPGGKSRFESVRNAFEALEPADIVMIHDAARPNVSSELLDRLLEAAKFHSAVIPVIPVVDTIKWVENGQVKQTLPRDKLFCAQTPQLFHVDVLRRAYVNPAEVTDEAALMERIGVPVHVVEGDRRNIKVTVPDDLLWIHSD